MEGKFNKIIKNFPWYPPTDLSLRAGPIGISGLDLLNRTLQPNPQNRISARDALLHPYFSDTLNRMQDINRYLAYLQQLAGFIQLPPVPPPHPYNIVLLPDHPLAAFVQEQYGVYQYGSRSAPVQDGYPQAEYFPQGQAYPPYQ